MTRGKRTVLPFVVLFLNSFCEIAAELTPFTVWDGDARSLLPQWVQYWIYFMFLMTATGFLFVKNHIEARWGVGAFVASHLASGAETVLLGAENFVVGMISINHCVFWTPAAVYLMCRLRKTDWMLPFSLWHVGMLGVFVFSLIFDYRDAFVYLVGGPTER